MAKYAREILDDLKEKVDLAHLINSYGVELKRNGPRYKGLCPFHNERTPSFNVSDDFFHCFGCGEGGDAFAFVQKMDHTSFVQAVEQLAQAYSYTLPAQDALSAEEEEHARLRRKVLAVLEASQEWLHNAYLELPPSHVARQELGPEKRNLDSSELIGEFSIGFCPAGWDTLTSFLKEKGFDQEALVESGMSTVTQRGGLIDRFRGRLMWSIRDIQGRTIGFGGRKLYEDDQAGKYLNSPETPVYHKKKVLYNLDKARKEIARSGTVFVVEGYTDIMACWDAGIHNVVASSGTAFTEDQINILRRLLDGYGDGKLGRIVYCFDGDSAGQKAARATLDLGTPLQARSYVLTIPENMDPCDYRYTHSNEALAEFFTNEHKRKTLVDFVLESEAKNHDIANANGRISYLGACIPILRKIQEEELRIQAMRRVSYLSGVKIAQVERFIKDNEFEADRYRDQIAPEEHETQADSPLVVTQKKILATIIQYPHLLPALEQAGLEEKLFSSRRFASLYYQALRGADSAHKARFEDAELASELATMDITPEGSEPSHYSLYAWVETLQAVERSHRRREALQRMGGMTEEGYQGVMEKDFYAVQEIAQMSLEELSRQEDNRKRVIVAPKKDGTGSKKDASVLLENIIRKKA